MKKNCNGCRALNGNMCMLGFKIKSKTFNGVEIGYIPLGKCPKPETYKEYFLQKKLLKK